jgi:hypothetical protein
MTSLERGKKSMIVVDNVVHRKQRIHIYIFYVVIGQKYKFFNIFDNKKYS